MSNATRVATYRAKQLAKATAMAKRVEELEACLRRIAEAQRVTVAGPGEMVFHEYHPAQWAREALEGSAKP